MPEFEWNRKKNEQLKAERDISLEEIVDAIYAGQSLAVVPHANPAKYPSQQVYVININDYAYLVPFCGEQQRC